jgi:tetraacyldisaccharide 4'-kinase
LILKLAGSVYGAAAAQRRRWYAQNPVRQRRLQQPVISVGNLSTGGAGKTPVVGRLAELLRAEGERPAILSRGYARRHAPDGVTVVSDGTDILVDVDHAGDEPLMLARRVAGVPVLVSVDRYLAGCLAEQRFGATVHILDDGFQHLVLARDIDLLLVDESDLSEDILPAGRLRERLGSASAAHALLVPDSSEAAIERLRDVLGVATAFVVRRSLAPPIWVQDGMPANLAAGSPVFVVAGVARPDRFFADVAAAGWPAAGTMSFRDHYQFSERDVDRISSAARAVGAAAILTTDKDAARFDARSAVDPPIARVPLTVSIEPSGFADWVIERLDRARAARQSPEPKGHPGA